MLFAISPLALPPTDTHKVRMMQIELTPLPKDAQLNRRKAVESLDWSRILLLLAWHWLVDWDARG